MREKLCIPEPAHGHRRTRKLRARSDLFPEPGPAQETLNSFLAKLAEPQVCDTDTQTETQTKTHIADTDTVLACLPCEACGAAGV